MFDKLTSAFKLFRLGAEIANAEKWKAGQITGTLLGGLLLALVNLAAAFGHPLPLDADTANTIGAGLLAVVNVVLTAVTSERAGLLPAKPANAAGPGPAGQPGGLSGLPPTAPAGVVQQPGGGPVSAAELRAARPDALDPASTQYIG